MDASPEMWLEKTALFLTPLHGTASWLPPNHLRNKLGGCLGSDAGLVSLARLQLIITKARPEAKPLIITRLITYQGLCKVRRCLFADWLTALPSDICARREPRDRKQEALSKFAALVHHIGSTASCS